MHLRTRLRQLQQFLEKSNQREQTLAAIADEQQTSELQLAVQATKDANKHEIDTRVVVYVVVYAVYVVYVVNRNVRSIRHVYFPVALSCVKLASDAPHPLPRLMTISQNM